MKNLKTNTINITFLNSEDILLKEYKKFKDLNNTSNNNFECYTVSNLNNSLDIKLLQDSNIVILPELEKRQLTKLIKKVKSITEDTALALLLNNKTEDYNENYCNRHGVDSIIFNKDLMQKNCEKHILKCIEKKQIERELFKARNFDSLTKLPNYNHFVKLLKDEVHKHYKSLENFALFTFKVNRFNIIAEKYGFYAGDLILKKIAQRIKAQSKDIVFSGYVGSQEFFVVVNNFDNLISCQAKIDKIIDNLSLPIIIEKSNFNFSISAGVSLFPNTSREAEKLIINAQMALEKARENTETSIVFYKSKMRQSNIAKRIIENALHNALENQEFELYFQPQVDIRSGLVSGAESLIRWNSKELGQVSPYDFIPIAEEIGFINKIGDWVLEETCSSIAKFSKIGLNIPISMNISGKQFAQKHFVESVAKAIKNSKIKIEKFVVEITESTIMNDIISSGNAIELLQSMGVQIHIDDFGTGYSSLSHLKLFPINGLKIDRTFVSGVIDNNSDAAITSSIIDLAHKLNLSIVAEGAETQAHIDYLKEHNCDYVQGYFYSKPLPFKEFSQWAANFNKSNKK